MLTNKQIADFQKHYQTEAERFHILPPGFTRIENIANRSRTVVKFIVRKWYLRTAKLLLQVGSDFTRKGVDRSIEALASLPESLRQNTVLCVVGQDKPKKFAALAERSGVGTNVHFSPDVMILRS